MLLAFLCDARAQTPPPERALVPANPTNQPASPTLHDAWLFEVLDLDIKKAVAAYEKVAADQRPANLDRWVAVARLAELKRLGVDVTLRVDPKEVPEPLRAPFENNSAPLPVADLLERVQGNPALLPPLHPITLVAEEWRLAQMQIPSLRELLKNREQNSRRSGGNGYSWVNKANAVDILRAELGGWRTGADARRALWFSNWQPPKLPGDPQPYLEKFKTNLEALLHDPEQSQYRSLLNTLRDTVNERAATDPAAALALVARLPIYAEKLLGLPAPAIR